ncbi:hypothetical protein [Alteromonas macleodii]|jgi:hypothetical protein|uniref:hypothetical protein n=1 Tax=Alteromonas macleodii TaxID=28108 RepID=UPI0024A920E6|nr:hypothetical protein [Alteromonas macleodii]|tara:strand:- start:53119 stop:53448 length:330 start_codon:yes stop_codon:yes gene_type:complete
MLSVTLESKTNSESDIPDKGQFNRRELDELIEEYSPIFETHKILSVNILTLPTYDFLHADGSLWDEHDHWEQTITQVSQNGVTLLFAHSLSGDELFFEYIKSDGVNQNA